MRYFIILILILFATSCKSSKRSVVAAANLVEERVEIKAETLGKVDTEVKTDLDETEVEVIKYEPVYYKKDGKDTVELKPVTYRRVDTKKLVEEVTKVDTTSTKSEQTESKQENSNRQVESEYKFYDAIGSIVKGVIGGFLAPFAKFAWIIGALLAAPIIVWLKRKLTKSDNKP